MGGRTIQESLTKTGIALSVTETRLLVPYHAVHPNLGISDVANSEAVSRDQYSFREKRLLFSMSRRDARQSLRFGGRMRFGATNATPKTIIIVVVFRRLEACLQVLRPNQFKRD